MEIVVNAGKKGQILIPKLLREEFNIIPSQSVVLEETENGLLIRKQESDPIKLFQATANKINAKKDQINNIEEEYKYRMKKAGINL